MRPIRWHREGRDRRDLRAVVVRRTAHQRPPGSRCRARTVARGGLLRARTSHWCRPPWTPGRGADENDEGAHSAISPSLVRVRPDHPARRTVTAGSAAKSARDPSPRVSRIEPAMTLRCPRGGASRRTGVPGEGHDGVALLTAADESRRNRRTYDAVLLHVVFRTGRRTAPSQPCRSARWWRPASGTGGVSRRHVRWEDFGPR